MTEGNEDPFCLGSSTWSLDKGLVDEPPTGSSWRGTGGCCLCYREDYGENIFKGEKVPKEEDAWS